MSTDTDIAAAARRAAADIRMAAHADALSLPVPDLVALLPLLDAAAAGPDADRVERWRGSWRDSILIASSGSAPAPGSNG